MARKPAKKTTARKARAGGAATSSRTDKRSASAAANTGLGHRDHAAMLRDALLAQVAVVGWRDLTFADIVAASGVSMADAYRAYQSKLGILRGLVHATDQAVLESLASDSLDGSPRDRLFDLIMRRLDQHSDDKAALSSLLHDLRRQPAEALCLTARLERSMAMTLDLAGIPSTGLRGIFRTKALTALYFHILGRWLKDDNADAAATMALLDKRLDQAERVLGFIRRARPKPPETAADHASH
jgi:AcrR family transcriptional regulator